MGAAKTQLRLGEILIEGGHITVEQLEHALRIQRESDDKKRLGAVLIENNIVSETLLNTAIAKRLNIRYVSIKDAKIDIEAVKKIPKAVAIKHCLIAVAFKQGVLLLCINDPLNYYAIEDVKLITGMQLEVQISDRDEIVKAINESYSEVETQVAAASANLSAGENIAFSYVDISASADDTPVVTFINSILYKGYTAGASDIHIEPFEEITMVRMRIDGQIVEYVSVSSSLHGSISARIKILSGMDIAEKRAPQDGHFRAKLQELELNVRVSSLPTVFGEKIVLRFLSGGGVSDNAGTFGMMPDDYKKMMTILQNPHGVIYFTGPTGSGKTTTLYSVIEMLSKRKVNIATVEDPVERTLPKINQSQVNPLAGLTFASALRSILRQDPDIVMIGETRDTETAQISVRAALTGHLVISTLHTNDSISSIVRLIDMGVEDYLLATSLVGIIAQRLVKKICTTCYTEYKPGENELRAIGADVPVLAHGKGCHLCANTGYKGRIAVHEILVIDKAISNLISAKAPTEDIYDYVFKNNKLKTLQTSLQKLVFERKTTVEEMIKVTYSV